MSDEEKDKPKKKQKFKHLMTVGWRMFGDDVSIKETRTEHIYMLRIKHSGITSPSFEKHLLQENLATLARSYSILLN